MRIVDLLDKRAIDLNGRAGSKSEAIDQMVELMVRSGKINNKEKYRKGVYAREEESTTGIGEGIAIPHCKSDAVTKAGLSAMVLKDGCDFDALDGQKVHLIFLIAAPDTSDNIHVDVLSKLSMLLMDEDFTNELKQAKDVDAFLAAIDRAETRKDEEDGVVAEAPKASQKMILAVTGCPTGIAHTYMAAEGLEKAAKAAGCYIKVETRGSGGAKNVLTSDEIRQADCIIVAADTKVPMERFGGKKVIQCQVSDGISKADQLIARAMNQDAPVYQADGKGEESSYEGGNDSIGHQIYKHLMNGVSHMLPFVVGGGILIAIAFLIDSVNVDLSSLPANAEEAAKLGETYSRSDFGTITPVAATLKGIGGTAFNFMLPVLAGFIAMSIADRPGLAVGFVGGAVAAGGTSGFLGALVAGFLAGYLVLGLKKVFHVIPESLDGLKPVLLYPLFGILLVGLIMNFIVEPPVGALNTLLNDTLKGMNGVSSVLLGLILGGMMAIDMGGPINKAAYVVGTGSIAAGNFNIMAAVMIGGMVPPIAIAAATLIFKKKFTQEERKAGPVNFVMGLAFITEGAIPYAAADPLRVIPSCVVGSAVAGALSMAFGCTLMAPHGGIFVFPVVGNAILYLVALLAGSVVSTVLLGLLKKNVEN